MIRRGDLLWAGLGDPLGSEPGHRRPVLVVQADEFNASRLATIIVLSLTSNLGLTRVPGCVLLRATETGLDRDSVANASQVRTIDRGRLDQHVGTLPDQIMHLVDAALRQTLGL